MTFRTHTCGELRKEHLNQTITVSGWIDTIRTHGNLTFLDLRDRYGSTQITLDGDLSSRATSLHKEDVVTIVGQVIAKPEPNKKLATGDIEIKASTLKVLNSSKALPLDDNASDETRLKYRYLDIRSRILPNLIFRNKVVKAARDFCDKEGFLDVETPLLVKSTPEGARDYVVPSRVNKGSFYALPQSPQLYKQILMIGGVDKYYQFARCLRDEDLRADRQPEHTQLDFEMSFVTGDDIREFVEGLYKYIFKETMNIQLDKFPVFSYEESMRRFGSDKPDLRFDLELQEVTDYAKKCEFNVFKEAEHITALVIPKLFSRKEIDKLTDLVKTYKAKGLAWAKKENDEVAGGVAKFLSPELTNLFKDGQTIFFVADKKKVAQTALGQLRQHLGNELGLADPQSFKFCWVKDFPLFSYNDDDKRWEPEHHMFSMPKEEFVDNFEKRPEQVLGDLWDVVLNGTELGSGSIRVSKPSVQERIMRFVNFSKEEAREKFGFLLEAYEYGGPVHGGMGLGVDRLVALMLGTNDIREVIAFPKNKAAQCPMDGSPSSIDPFQLDELNINIKK